MGMQVRAYFNYNARYLCDWFPQMLFLDEIIKASTEPIVDDVDDLTSILAEFSVDFPGTFPWVLIPGETETWQIIHPDLKRRECVSMPPVYFDKLLRGTCCSFITDEEKLPEPCCSQSKQWDGALLQRVHSRKDGEVYLIIGLTGIAGHELVRGPEYQALLAPLMSTVLRSYINGKAADRDAARLNAALDEIRIIKEKLLPPRDFPVQGMRHARHYVPYLAGGGDYFEMVDLRPQRRQIGMHDTGYYWGGMIVDVSGHGPAAAVEVAMMDAILRTYRPSYGMGTGDVIKYINRHLFTRQIRGHFITAMMFSYDGAGNTLYYNSAGHPPGFIKHADPNRGISVLDKGKGIPLGVMQESEWEGSQTEMFTGDLLILYTDGVSEAKDPLGRYYSRDRMIDAIKACPRQEPQAMVNTIVESVTRHRGDRERSDDETLLVLQPVT